MLGVQNKDLGSALQTLLTGPRPLSVYQDLSMHHEWPIKKAIVDLPLRLKGNLKHILGC